MGTMTSRTGRDRRPSLEESIKRQTVGHAKKKDAFSVHAVISAGVTQDGVGLTVKGERGHLLFVNNHYLFQIPKSPMMSTYLSDTEFPFPIFLLKFMSGFIATLAWQSLS